MLQTLTLSNKPAKVLESQEKEMKQKYLQARLERRRHFPPFVCSVWMACCLLDERQESFAKKRLEADKLAASKWEESCSQVCG